MKRLLFISPEAFGYYKKIITSLEESGYEVDWLHQIPSESPFIKGFVRYLPRFGEVYSNTYFARSIKWDVVYDVVLVIKGEGLSTSMLGRLREHFKAAKFVFYNWDSFDNSLSALKKLKFFDIIKTFDTYDSETLDNVLLHPLFHCIPANFIKEQPQCCEYSSFFAGTIHSNRYLKIKNIAKKISVITGNQSYLFFFYPSVLIFYVKKLLSREFRAIPYQQVSFNKQTTAVLLNEMQRAAVVIDICNASQNGLTMRTIEAVGLRKKIITNNVNITKYSFYHPNNVLLIDELTDEKLKWFLNVDYFKYEDQIYADLHISRWLQLLIKDD